MSLYPMPVYILLSTLTEHGVSRIIEEPSCLRRLGMDIEKLGVKVLDQYATLGQFDFVVGIRHCGKIT